jgi:hypothetical protein
MESKNSIERKSAAQLAKRFYEKEISFEEFTNLYPETNDEKIEDLFDLIEHEPKSGGFLGVSEIEYQNYMNKIYRLIDELMV